MLNIRNKSSSDVKARLQALKKLLENEKSSTQEELRDQLESLDFDVNQSTVSRDLRKIGAIKTTDIKGRTTYRLAYDAPVQAAPEALSDLIRSIKSNGAMIVVTTAPGSASLIAHQIDALKLDTILGTIAGDDVVFVAPSSFKKIDSIMHTIAKSLIK